MIALKSPFLAAWPAANDVPNGCIGELDLQPSRTHRGYWIRDHADRGLNRKSFVMWPSRLITAFFIMAISPISVFTGLLAVLPASGGWAADTIVRDGGTLQLADVTYRLDGIDAPELDQICLDDHADAWACGEEARDQLTRLIGSRKVRCENLGRAAFKKRYLGICTIEGETVSLNQFLVRQGFALNGHASKFEPAATGPFAADETASKKDRRGLWKGCFVAPQDFRRGRKDGALLGESCRPDKDREIRAVLFPEDPAMPAGCNIKGKFAVRARVTGNVGVYHLQGCRSYPALAKPDRWFCSEDDAQAEGFRKAYNCRAGVQKPM